MNLPDSPSSVPPSVPAASPVFACIRCSDRKVRCNKQNPCNSCIRHNVPCIYRNSKPARRPRQGSRMKILEARLLRSEGLLRERGIDPNKVMTPSDAELLPENSIKTLSGKPETAWKLPIQTRIFKPQLVQGQRGTELVDNSLWSRVTEEIDSGDGGNEDEASASEASHSETSEDDLTYVLGINSTPSQVPHPPAELIHQLWQVFADNVNPVTKLVHMPTLQLAIEKAIRNIECVPRGFEALMFAIYSMAVLSLTDAESIKLLKETRVVLLARYVRATKAALVRANFMSSTSVVVLQALLLHVFSIRDTYEPRAVWGLTGVVIRVAEGMGLGLDGTLLGLSPFDTEIRRRIWWQIRLHDFHAAELCGQAKFRDFKIDETTPKKPANIDDNDIYPSMSQAPVESTRPTEMIWCVFRSELASFAATQISRMRKEGKPPSISAEYAAMDDSKMRDIFIQNLEDMAETKYLRFCDPAQPLQLFTLGSARNASTIARFLAHHPRRWARLDQVPQAEQDLVWGFVVQLLERYNMLQSTPQLQRFAWNIPYFINWAAIIHVLDTLRANPLRPDAMKTWKLVDALFQNNAQLLLQTKRPIYLAVGNLCLHAYKARETALSSTGVESSDLPDYIISLREEREAARARKSDASLRSKRLASATNTDRLSATASSDTIQPGTYIRFQTGQPEQYVEPSPLPNASHSTYTWDDAFWLNNEADFPLSADGMVDMMDLDMDAILAQDLPESGKAIDWAQWDAYLTSLDFLSATNANVG